MPKSVFVAVLDWGLGHATRCVPVIRELKNRNARVMIGGNGQSLLFLKDEFKELDFCELPAYNIEYSSKGSLAKAMLLQLPKILNRIKEEREVLHEIIEKEKIDFVISDNRYGCYSKKIMSVFIGHQLNIKMPVGFSFLSGIVNRLHVNKIKKFDEVWIPDEQNGFGFSGELSTCDLSNLRHLGILSRFGSNVDTPSEYFEIVALASGPEPARTGFENVLREQLTSLGKKSLLVKGKPGKNLKRVNGFLTEVDHLNSTELETVVKQARIIISRSGYSTIMDLAALGKKAIFIPTPGQTEQEYLAEYLAQNGMAVYQKQNQFNIETGIARLNAISPLPLTKPNSKLKEVIDALISENGKEW